MNPFWYLTNTIKVHSMQERIRAQSLQSTECQFVDWTWHRGFCRFTSAKRAKLQEQDPQASKAFRQACRLSAVVHDLAHSLVPCPARDLGLEISFHFTGRRLAVEVEFGLFLTKQLKQSVRDHCLSMVPNDKPFIILCVSIAGQKVIRSLLLEGPFENPPPPDEEFRHRIVAALQRLGTLKRYGTISAKLNLPRL
ncbi:hypothetical protein M422DRAFT_266285 [Sphaerobolus stellatus SS14]|uniref:Uncharacterized protein n=1 Tax=Sphaerobolus stellatus (strain SS14) TaxID=990650 RepID=A0A0C9V399_SPHS4|nr:hypothetical protein M422DRAFT_266285 [Sphaerobolus stellatus SS14]